MIRLLLLAALGGALADADHITHDSSLCDKSLSKLVLCYYEGRIPVQNVEPCLCTHIVHKTAARIAGNFSVVVDSGMSHLTAALNERNPNVRQLLRLDTHQYSDPLVKSKQKRSLFLSNIGQILNENNIDGVELHLDLGPRGRTDGLSVMLKELRSELDNQKKALFLTLQLQPEVLVKRYDIKNITKYVDYLVVPTDNMTDTSLGDVTYHPSRLMGLSDIFNTDSIIDLLAGLGAPKEKMIVTIPAKVTEFTLKDKKINTPGSAAASTPNTMNQEQLCSLLKEGNWTVEREEDLTAPYAFKETTWVAFEDSISTGIKAKYVMLRELAGAAVMSIDDEDIVGSCPPLANSSNWIRQSLYNTFTSLSRKPRGVVLESLEEEIKESTLLTFSGNIRLSPYRITRIVDTAGDIHVVRKDARTQFECSRQGYFVHPQGCNRFYRCVKFHQYSADFTVFEYDCPAGLAFDERWEVCVWPGSLPRGAPCSGSSEIAPVPRARYSCPAVEGYYADPENCRWFFACLDHARDGATPLTAYEFRCPFGLVFDQSKLICDWPWAVDGCGSGAEGIAFSGAVGLTAASGIKYVSASADDNNAPSGKAFGGSGGLGNIGYAPSYVSTQSDGFGKLNLDRNVPAYAAFPDSFVSGGRIENSGGVVLESHLAPAPAQTISSNVKYTENKVFDAPVFTQPISYKANAFVSPSVNSVSLQPLSEQYEVRANAVNTHSYALPVHNVVSNVGIAHQTTVPKFSAAPIGTSHIVEQQSVPIANRQHIITGAPSVTLHQTYGQAQPVSSEIRNVLPPVSYSQNLLKQAQPVFVEPPKVPITGTSHNINIVHETPVVQEKYLQKSYPVPSVEIQAPVQEFITNVNAAPRVPVVQQTFVRSRPNTEDAPIVNSIEVSPVLDENFARPRPVVSHSFTRFHNTPTVSVSQNIPIVQQSFVQAKPSIVKSQDIPVINTPIVSVTPKVQVHQASLPNINFVSNVQEVPALQDISAAPKNSVYQQSYVQHPRPFEKTVETRVLNTPVVSVTPKIQVQHVPLPLPSFKAEEFPVAQNLPTTPQTPAFQADYIKSPPYVLQPPLAPIIHNSPRNGIAPNALFAQQTFVESQPKFVTPSPAPIVNFHSSVPVDQQNFVSDKQLLPVNRRIPLAPTVSSTFVQAVPSTYRTIESRPTFVTTPRPVESIAPIGVSVNGPVLQQEYTPVQPIFSRSRRPQINVTPKAKLLEPVTPAGVLVNFPGVEQGYTPAQSIFTKSRRPQITVTSSPATPLFVETPVSYFSPSNVIQEQAIDVDVTPRAPVFSSTTESVSYTSRQPNFSRSRIRPVTTSTFIPTSRPAVKIDQAVIAVPSSTAATVSDYPSTVRTIAKSQRPTLAAYFSDYGRTQTETPVPFIVRDDGDFGIRIAPPSINLVNERKLSSSSTPASEPQFVPIKSRTRVNSNENVEKLLDTYGNGRNRDNDDFVDTVIKDDLSRKGRIHSNPDVRNRITNTVTPSSIRSRYEPVRTSTSSLDNELLLNDGQDNTELGTATYYSPDGGVGFEAVKIGYEEDPDDDKSPIVVVTRLSDANPLLVAKLGAQCTCRSNTVTLRRPNKNRTLPPAKLDSQSSNIVPVARQNILVSSDRPVAIQNSLDTAALRTSSDGAYVKPITSVPLQRSSTERIVPTTGTYTEANVRSLDRYGPGGLRSLDETLQGSVDCQRPGLFRHPKFCNKFYACHWDDCKKRYTLHVFNCPIQLAYDSDLGACNWPSAGPSCAENNLLL